MDCIFLMLVVFHNLENTDEPECECVAIQKILSTLAVEEGKFFIFASFIFNILVCVLSVMVKFLK